MTHSIKSPKKLIEVALPLDDINEACAHEKMPGIGAHPRGIHLWWARRPLAAARAVIFAQMVNDPGYQQDQGFKFGVNKHEAEIKREKLFKIIRDLVKWENANNEEVLKRAREAIWESWRETCLLNENHPQAADLFNPEILPEFHDPFAGGGALPLEAQRLGLKSNASDLNPVAVMINKAMIEIPQRFIGFSPIGPIPDVDKTNKKNAINDMHQEWNGVQGLAEDVRRYGCWMREQAIEKIGNLYPKVKITSEMIEERPDLADYLHNELNVIAWIWVRTVKSPNPIFSHVDVPLASNFILSSRAGKEAWIEPIVNENSYEFKVRIGKPPIDAKNGTKSARGANFNCLLSHTPINGDHIKREGVEGRMGLRLMAIVVEGNKGRIYLSPTQDAENIAKEVQPYWKPETNIPLDKRSMFTPLYGLSKFGDLFTARQLVSLTTFSDLVKEARTKAIADAIAAGMPDDGISCDLGGRGATAYGDALAVYLSFCVDRLADYNSSIATWKASGEQVMQTYKRQAIPMTWDFPESNVLGDKSICWLKALKYTVDNLNVTAQLNGLRDGAVFQADAAKQDISINKVISTDPPYYDNIGYADLSDFFYVWMRRSLKHIYPALFSTIAVPKTEELVANPYRQGSKEKAESFFLDGMTQTMQNLVNHAHPVFPVTIYYAFKQSETHSENTSSTGWETFLEAVVKAGFSIDGTWPMRTELSNRMIASGTNSLASSVVLVCRKRSESAETLSRREFQRELRNKMPEALETMIGGESGLTPIAPVDLAQAAIGPGMAIYSKYNSILNQDGSALSVHDALVMINQAITDYLNPDSGSSDSDTLFCSAWFEQYGWGVGSFGEADTLARAKGTSVDGVRDAGVIESSAGKVRLLKWSEYPTDYDPRTDKRNPIWEACHQIIRVLQMQGENSAGQLLSRMPEHGEAIRQLAYHLYTLCERKKWAEEARAYNELIGSWSAISAASYEVGHVQEQVGFDF